MPDWFGESNVQGQWDAVTVTEAGVSGKEFIDASTCIINLFDLVLGSASGIVKGDMMGNATTLGKHITDSGAGTVQATVDAEIASMDAGKLKKAIGDGKTAVCAMLWLTRCAARRAARRSPLTARAARPSAPQ